MNKQKPQVISSSGRNKSSLTQFEQFHPVPRSVCAVVVHGHVICCLVPLGVIANMFIIVNRHVSCIVHGVPVAPFHKTADLARLDLNLIVRHGTATIWN